MNELKELVKKLIAERRLTFSEEETRDVDLRELRKTLALWCGLKVVRLSSQYVIAPVTWATDTVSAVWETLQEECADPHAVYNIIVSRRTPLENCTGPACAHLCMAKALLDIQLEPPEEPENEKRICFDGACIVIKQIGEDRYYVSFA